MNILKKLFDRNYGLEEDFQDYCNKHKCKKEYWGNTGRGVKFYCPECNDEFMEKDVIKEFMKKKKGKK